MKIDEFKVIEDCIERGINSGYIKAYKHNSRPTKDYIKQCIADLILLEICEYFEFPELNKDKI